MARRDSIFLVDPSLKARSATEALQRWITVGDLRPPTQDEPTTEELPISPDGSLMPGALYRSSTEPGLHYFLPRFTLRHEAGRPGVHLRWRGPDEDPDGPLAHLTLELLGEEPRHDRVELREIEHRSVARLRYRLPVEDPATARRRPPRPRPRPRPNRRLARFFGMWANVDVATRGMTRLEIRPGERDGFVMHGFGKCGPGECDWQPTPGRLARGAAVGVYDFGFKTMRITARLEGDQLVAEVFDDYREGDRRADRTRHYVMRRAPREAPEETPRLSLELGALERTDGHLWRIRHDIHSREDFDRFYRILTEESFQAGLEIRSFATVGHRTWRQVVLDPKRTRKTAAELKERGVFRFNARHRQGRLAPEGVRTGIGSIDATVLGTDRPDVVLDTNRLGTLVGRSLPRLLPTQPVARLDLPTVLGNLTRPPILGTPFPRPQFPRPQSPRPQSPRPQSPRPTPSRPPSGGRPAGGTATPGPPTPRPPIRLPSADLPRLDLHRSLLDSDLLIARGRFAERVIPTNVLVDRRGEAALLRVKAEALQEIRPLWFPVPPHGDLFDEPADPDAHHVLIKEDLILDGTSVTFFQDSALRDQFYYEPQEFRLARQATTPHLPEMLIFFYEFVGEDESFDYRARLVFRARPHLDPRTLQRARATFGESARFTALEPLSSALELRLPVDETGGNPASVERPDAVISFDDGIRDELDLSPSELKQLFAGFRAPGALGFDGSARATLFDGTEVEVPVRLSLAETTGTVLSRRFEGPSPDDGTGDQSVAGRYRVTLTNRLESPVSLQEIFPSQVGDAVAHPEALGLPLEVAPGTDVAIDYRVVPPEAPVLDIEPLLTVSIAPDHDSLWPRVMINEGYSADSDTFTIEVEIDPAFFTATPPEGMEPLTGVRVELSGDAEAVLTPDSPRASVSLKMPPLDWLLDRPEARRYRFRVTDLHADGDGAQGEWADGEGDLFVTPAAVGA